jgi:GLPGLI family protein
MKKYVFFIFIFPFFLLNAQENTQNLTGKVQYVASRNDGIFNKSLKKKLVFTTSQSVFFDPVDEDDPKEKDKKKSEVLNNSKIDSLKKKIEEDNKNNKAHSGTNYNVHKAIDEILFTRLKNREIVHQKGIYDVNKGKNEGYILTEGIPALEWKIANEFKEISGFKAQKASCHFRGRDYTAWFTPEIPVPFGPWKLQGLPGLILSASDQQGDVVFYAKSVTIPYTLSKKQQEQLKLNNNFKSLSLKTYTKKKRQEENRKKKTFEARLSGLSDGESMSRTTFKSFPKEKNYKDLFDKEN